MMSRVQIPLLVSILCCSFGCPAVKAVEGAWPAWRGHDGSGSAVDCDQALQTDFTVCAVWEGAEAILPVHAGVHGNKGKLGGVQSSLVVADGLVYYFNSHGAEEPLVLRAHKEVGQAHIARYHPDMDVELWKRYKHNVAGDDVVLAFDAKTGALAWKQVLKDRGLNFNAWNYGPHLTPCYADGKLFVVGSTCRIYCLDGRTGELLWEQKSLYHAKLWAQRRAAALKNKSMVAVNRGRYEVLAVADGVVYAYGHGLDAASGKVLWSPTGKRAHVAYHDFPLVWKHQGREYFICGSTCIDPQTGKSLWKGAGRGGMTPVIAGDKLIQRGARDKKNPGNGVGYNCWTMTLTGVTRAWALPAEYACTATATPVVHRQRLYGFFGKGKGQADVQLACIDVQTGAVLAEMECVGKQGSCKTSSLFATDGLVFYRGPDKHGHGFLHVVKADPNDFKRLAVITPPSFETSATPAVANGVIYLRGLERVYGIDLKLTPSITANARLRSLP